MNSHSKVRKNAPKQFGAEIPRIEPYPIPVDGVELLNSMESTFRAFTVVREEEASALALFTMFTHAHDAFQISPILAIVSPEKRCGKSTMLSLLTHLVRAPLGASNITAAVIYRCISVYQPTLMLDEADTFLAAKPELVGILNSGQLRSLARVGRAKPDTLEPEFFSTWAPKVIAMIGQLASTLDDRSVTIRMRRKLPSEAVQKIGTSSLPLLKEIASRAARWTNDHMSQLRDATPALPEELHDRAKDNWTPLLAIADEAGGAWPEKARRAARLLTDVRGAGEDTATRLLSDIRDVFDDQGDPSITSRDLLDMLCAIEDAPWSESIAGKKLSGNSLAARVRAFGIHPKTLWNTHERKSVKGYELEDFHDAFRRYLPSRSSGESGECIEVPVILTDLTV